MTMIPYRKKEGENVPEKMLFDPEAIGKVLESETRTTLKEDITFMFTLLQALPTREYVDNLVNHSSMANIKGRVDTVELLPTEGNTNGDLWYVGTVDSATKRQFVFFQDGETPGAFQEFGTVDSQTASLEGYLTEAQVMSLYATLNDKIAGISSSGVTKPVGEVSRMMRTGVVPGHLRCDGTTKNVADHVDFVTDELVGGTVPRVTLAEYDAQVTAYGSCYMFGMDDGAETFRVPIIVEPGMEDQADHVKYQMFVCVSTLANL